jgi:hypothetical protein
MINQTFSAIPITAISWSVMSNYFIDSTHNGDNQMPMVNLIDTIMRTERWKMLSGYISSNTVIVSNQNPIEPFKNALHIEFNSPMFSFVYYGKRFQEIVLKREFSEEQGITKFNNIIDLCQW